MEWLLLVCWVWSQLISPVVVTIVIVVQRHHPNTTTITPQAKALLEKGCARSYGPACFNLAVMYKKGDEGVPK